MGILETLYRGEVTEYVRRLLGDAGPRGGGEMRGMKWRGQAHSRTSLELRFRKDLNRKYEEGKCDSSRAIGCDLSHSSGKWCLARTLSP